MKAPTVLLVEDSEDDAYLFNWRFKQSGVLCEVCHVVDGAAAMDFLRRASASNPEELPCIIFLDLKMPIMNGFEVLTWLREQEHLSLIPVVVLSGSDQDSDKDRARQLGAADYLVKPVRAIDIRRHLADVCTPVADTSLQPGKART